jgi:uncharacterized protein YfaQ (DUF2300 family)
MYRSIIGETHFRRNRRSVFWHGQCITRARRLVRHPGLEFEGEDVDQDWTVNQLMRKERPALLTDLERKKEAAAGCRDENGRITVS